MGVLQRRDHVPRAAAARPVVLHVATLGHYGRAAAVSDGTGHKTDLDQLGQLVPGHLGGPQLLGRGGVGHNYGRTVKVHLAAVLVGRVAYVGLHSDHPVRAQVGGLVEHPAESSADEPPSRRRPEPGPAPPSPGCAGPSRNRRTGSNTRRHTNNWTNWIFARNSNPAPTPAARPPSPSKRQNRGS